METKKKTALIVVFALVLGGILIASALFLFSEIKEKTEEITALRREILLSEGKTGNVSHIKKEFLGIKPNLDRIDDLFVDPEAPVNFIEFIEKTAADTGISVEISPINLKEEDGLGFQIKTIGGSQDCLEYLEKIESAFYLKEIKSISFNKLEEADLNSERYQQFSLGDIIMNIKLKAFTE